MADQLGQAPAAQQLKHSLLEQLPGEGDEEELGYGAWFRAADQQVVVRHLDLRQVTSQNKHLFCEAAKHAALVERAEEWLQVSLSDLAEMVERAEHGEPPLSKSDWREFVPPKGGPIGPGWSAA